MKCNKLLSCLIAALIVTASTFSVNAADIAPAGQKSEGDQHEQSGQQLKRNKRLGKEQRETRRKELEKRLEELRKKKTDGTLTKREKNQLARLEQALKDGGKRPGAKTQPGKHGKDTDKKS